MVGGQHFNIFFVRQGVRGQSGQHAFRAALYEQAHAGIVGGLELFNPFHRVRNLRNHKVFDFFRVARVEFRRNIGSNRHLGGVERKRIQECAVLRHSRAHDSRVEGVGNRDLHRLNTHIGKHLNCIIHGFASARNNRLGRAVLVSHRHITVNAYKFGFYAFHRSRDRSHFAVVFYLNFRHYFAAGANSLQAVFKIKNTGGYGSGIFTQTVAHYHIRLDAERGQKTHHRDIGRKYSRLGHFGLFDSGFTQGNLLFGFAGFAPQSIRQILADNAHQQAVGFVKGILHNFILGSQVLHHIHILGTLSGEHKADFRFDFRRGKRINTFHTQVQRFFFPYVLGRSGLLEKFNFFF